ncbi:MAG: chromate transporter [Bacillota bacterium]
MVWWQVFMAFARVGILGYGGGPAFIPLVEIEAVDNYHWMTTAEFADVLGMANVLPGPIGTKMAGYIGYKVGGPLGAVAALAGVVMPSLVAMLVLYHLLGMFRAVPWVQGMIRAVKPVVVVLLLHLVWDMVPSSFASWKGIAVAVVSLALIQFARVHPALVIVGALATGAIFFR